MIKDDYVSFETAKLLKEKGFDDNCFYVWVNADNQTPSLLATANFVEGEIATNRETLDAVTQYHMITYESNNKIESFLCPTLQMVMRWLRDTHNIVIVINFITEHYRADINAFSWVIYTANNHLGWDKTESKKSLISYEEACENAIKYCLENLI